jgi:hypothetical protein
MKKQYIAIIILAVVAAGVIGYAQLQKNKGKNTPQNFSIPNNATSTNQIKYSDNPKIIGKELVGLTSIPDKYKPEDTVIDIDQMVDNEILKKIETCKVTTDFNKIFEAKGMNDSYCAVSLYVEILYTGNVKFSGGSPVYPPLNSKENTWYRLKSKNLSDGFISNTLGYIWVNHGDDVVGFYVTGGIEPSDYEIRQLKPSFIAVMSNLHFLK